MISKLALIISEGGIVLSHELMGNAVAEVEFANRNRIMENEIWLNSTTARGRCWFCFVFFLFLITTGLSAIPLVNISSFLNSKHNV